MTLVSRNMALAEEGELTEGKQERMGQQEGF